MTPSDLKYYVEQSGHESNFFSHQTMNFFGDTMANFGCRSAIVETRDGQQVECWELWRKRTVKGKLSKSAFFDKATYERIFPKLEWERGAK